MLARSASTFLRVAWVGPSAGAGFVLEPAPAGVNTAFFRSPAPAWAIARLAVVCWHSSRRAPCCSHSRPSLLRNKHAAFFGGSQPTLGDSNEQPSQHRRHSSFQTHAAHGEQRASRCTAWNARCNRATALHALECGKRLGRAGAGLRPAALTRLLGDEDEEGNAGVSFTVVFARGAESFQSAPSTPSPARGR